jgi:hypothetical protein
MTKEDIIAYAEKLGYNVFFEDGACFVEKKQEDFCDANCVWTNHHPECERGKQDD